MSPQAAPDGPSRTVRIAITWLVLGTLVFLAMQAWLSHQERTRFHAVGGVITLKRAPDGHYHWPGRINGAPVVFMVDTGATRTALPPDLASDAGVTLLGKSRSNTAGGEVVVQDALADLELQGGLRAEKLRVGVLPRLDTPLLGMDVLGRLSITQRDGEMRIELPGRSRAP